MPQTGYGAPPFPAWFPLSCSLQLSPMLPWNGRNPRPPATKLLNKPREFCLVSALTLLHCGYCSRPSSLSSPHRSEGNPAVCPAGETYTASSVDRQTHSRVKTRVHLITSQKIVSLYSTGKLPHKAEWLTSPTTYKTSLSMKM